MHTFHSIGSGPGLVVLHGAMQSGSSQRDLAELLAPHHTVHLVDRSTPTAPPGGTTAAEVSALSAVLAATGATDVLGISSGAIVAARTALAGAGIRRLALFEPPLSLAGSMRLDLLPRATAALERGDLPLAMALAMRVSEMGPPWMFRLPTPLLSVMSRRMLSADAKRATPPGGVPLSTRARGLATDVALVTENADTVADFAGIAVPTLLIDGTATRPYLRTAVDALERAIPGARRVRLAGQNHGATQNRDEWGRPDRVAPSLLEFFTPRTGRG